jgi:methionyl-tRNA formyltransferase
MSNYKDLRIVFMGTPEFAVASLDALVKAKCNIVGVYTAPDKPAGRGMKMTESCSKKICSSSSSESLYNTEKLKNEQFLEELRSLNADFKLLLHSVCYRIGVEHATVGTTSIFMEVC